MTVAKPSFQYPKASQERNAHQHRAFLAVVSVIFQKNSESLNTFEITHVAVVRLVNPMGFQSKDFQKRTHIALQTVSTKMLSLETEYSNLDISEDMGREQVSHYQYCQHQRPSLSSYFAKASLDIELHFAPCPWSRQPFQFQS